MSRFTCWVRGVWFAVLGLSLPGPVAWTRGAEVSGKVAMSDLCSPRVSSAVVFLSLRGEPQTDQLLSKAAPGPGELPSVVIRQDSLQFLPRVLAVAPGQGVRLEQGDGETHHVQIRSLNGEGSRPNAIGSAGVFTPPGPGVFQLDCTDHLHKRGYLIVGPTPWVQVCTPEGNYAFRDVPAGTYVLTAWHEMGEPQRSVIEVREGQSLTLPRINLSGSLSLGTLVRKDIQLTTAVTAPVRPWREPLDQISVLLAAARNLLHPPADLRKALRLAEDAYWGECEASDLESAIRIHLGNERASTVATRFGDFRRALSDVANGRQEASVLSELTRALLFDLGDAVGALDALGVLDNRSIAESRSASGSAARRVEADPQSRAFALQALKRALHRVQFHADRNVPEDAAGALTAVLAADFSPLRNDLLVHRPWSAWRLDRQFNALQGDLGAGLKGDALADRFEQMASELDAIHGELRETPAGAIGPPFAALLVGVVVTGFVAALVVPIAAAAAGGTLSASARLVLTLAAVLGLAAGLGSRPLTGNLLAENSQAVEGWTDLILGGLVFEGARRWVGRARSSGSWRTPAILPAGWLALFVAIFAMSQTVQARVTAPCPVSERLAALAGGLAGLAVLIGVAWLAGRAARRLGCRGRNVVTAVLLFAVSIAMAGTGLFALQNTGVISVTPLSWPVHGGMIPGFHPSLEVVLPQLAGLVAAFFWALLAIRRMAPQSEPGVSTASPRLHRDSEQVAGPAISPIGVES